MSNVLSLDAGALKFCMWEKKERAGLEDENGWGRGAINMRIRRRKRAHKIILWLQSCFKFLLRGQMWRKSSGQKLLKIND